MPFASIVANFATDGALANATVGRHCESPALENENGRKKRPFSGEHANVIVCSNSAPAAARRGRAKANQRGAEQQQRGRHGDRG